jgi:hypothetical protein
MKLTRARTSRSCWAMTSESHDVVRRRLVSYEHKRRTSARKLLNEDESNVWRQSVYCCAPLTQHSNRQVAKRSLPTSARGDGKAFARTLQPSPTRRCARPVTALMLRERTKACAAGSRHLSTRTVRPVCGFRANISPISPHTLRSRGINAFPRWTAMATSRDTPYTISCGHHARWELLDARTKD